MDPELYKDKYRIKSARSPGWDYSSNGCYFVTICTQNREYLFGELSVFVETCHGTSLQQKQRQRIQQQTTEIGKIAQQCWLDIPNHFPFVTLDEFVIMPNHIHGIVVIDRKDDGRHNETAIAVDTSVIDIPVPVPVPVETCHGTSLQRQRQRQRRIPPPGKDSLSLIVNQYKGAVKRQANNMNISFSWQPRFHDHIIRKDDELQRIREYIIHNPDNWKTDELFSKNRGNDENNQS